MTTIQEVVLQIKDKNIKWENNVEETYFKKKKSLFFFATYTYCPDACPNCGCVNRNFSIVKNGTRTSRITLNPVSGLPAFLKLRKQVFSAVNAPIVLLLIQLVLLTVMVLFLKM